MLDRSHPFAFSIDGNCQCLILCGNSETDSQLWMKELRHFLWPKNNLMAAAQPNFWLRREGKKILHYFVSFFFCVKWHDVHLFFQLDFSSSDTWWCSSSKIIFTIGLIQYLFTNLVHIFHKQNSADLTWYPMLPTTMWFKTVKNKQF